MSEYITIPLSKTGKHAGLYETIVSPEDADLSEQSWCVKPVTRSRVLYAMRTAYHKTILMHRIVLERVLDRPLVKGEFVDHINGDGLDNRRKNLRLATTQQNRGNATSHSNATGYKGVSWHKQGKKYQAKIKVNNKTIYLGLHKTAEEAHAAYCEAAVKYFGEFARFE